MSRKHKETITCPGCGQVNDFTVWNSLNGDLDPEAKQQLMDGTLFQFECSNCGHKCNVNYGLLYHDMTHQVMVYYVDEESVEQTQEMMEDAEKSTGIEMAGYRNRIVTSQNSLREKAIIFEYGLDDRVIEIMKLIYYADVNNRFPDANITAIFFLVADGKYFLDFIGDTPLNAEIPTSVYDNIKNEFAERLADAGDKESIIDLGWALNFWKQKKD